MEHLLIRRRPYVLPKNAVRKFLGRTHLLIIGKTWRKLPEFKIGREGATKRVIRFEAKLLAVTIAALIEGPHDMLQNKIVVQGVVHDGFGR